MAAFGYAETINWIAAEIRRLREDESERQRATKRQNVSVL
jgi:hypothetical protein